MSAIRFSAPPKRNASRNRYSLPIAAATTQPHHPPRPSHCFNNHIVRKRHSLSQTSDSIKKTRYSSAACGVPVVSKSLLTDDDDNSCPQSSRRQSNAATALKKQDNSLPSSFPSYDDSIYRKKKHRKLDRLLCSLLTLVAATENGKTHYHSDSLEYFDNFVGFCQMTTPQLFQQHFSGYSIRKKKNSTFGFSMHVVNHSFATDRLEEMVQEMEAHNSSSAIVGEEVLGKLQGRNLSQTKLHRTGWERIQLLTLTFHAARYLLESAQPPGFDHLEASEVVSFIRFMSVDCPNCDTYLESMRHLFVAFRDRPSREAQRHFLCEIWKGRNKKLENTATNKPALFIRSREMLGGNLSLELEAESVARFAMSVHDCCPNKNQRGWVFTKQSLRQRQSEGLFDKVWWDLLGCALYKIYFKHKFQHGVVLNSRVNEILTDRGYPVEISSGTRSLRNNRPCVEKASKQACSTP